MTYQQLVILLREARHVLERCARFDDDSRDDIEQMCEKIDAALSEVEPQQQIA